MHALNKNILLYLQILAILNNTPILLIDIIINSLIIFHYYFIICIRLSRSSQVNRLLPLFFLYL